MCVISKNATWKLSKYKTHKSLLVRHEVQYLTRIEKSVCGTYFSQPWGYVAVSSVSRATRWGNAYKTVVEEE